MFLSVYTLFCECVIVYAYFCLGLFGFVLVCVDDIVCIVLCLYLLLIMSRNIKEKEGCRGKQKCYYSVGFLHNILYC